MFGQKKFSLALSSGSAKGLAHLGVIKAIKEKKYEINALSGSSAGAVACALFAFDKLDEFEDWVNSLDKKSSLRLFDFNFIPTNGLISGDRFVDILNKFLKDKNIEDSPIPLYICTTSIATGQTIYISKGNLVNALRASIAIPGIFEPFKLNGIYCFDGAVSNPLPVKILIENGFSKVIAVDLNYHIKEPPIKEMPNIFNSITRAINIVSKNATCDEGYINKVKYLIRPKLCDFGMFDFYRSKELIQKGYEEAIKIFT